MLAALTYWKEALRTATSDRYHTEVKKNHEIALQAYAYAVRTAVVSANGTNHEHEKE